MKLPRDVSAERLVSALNRLGYRLIHQRGSHAKLRHDGPPAHTVSVPMHRSIKTGMLHAVISEVAKMRSVTVQSIVESL